MFRYKPGKKDWMGNGLPIEGKEAHVQRAGDLARQDVPTCSLADRMDDVKERVQKAGWDSCVVVIANGVALGLLRSESLEADPQNTAEQSMEIGSRTYRQDAPLEKTMQYMQNKGVDSVLITNSDGKLVGMLKREDIEKALSE
jgi:predicted transcriptional regulator